jgi:tetratricopeptide (TPR) repeat protein
MVFNHFRNIQFNCIVFFLTFTVNTFSQNASDCDLKFIDHLVKTGCFEEALYLLDSRGCLLFQMNDSVNYLKGWSLYSLDSLESSSEYLLKINTESSLYLKSHFYAAYNYSQSGNYEKAMDVLDKINLNSENLISLKNYQIAGIKLLQGDIPSFEEWFNRSNGIHSEIIKSSNDLRNISEGMKNHKDKSPLIAGLLSGIVPGSGKLYAGKKGEAIAAFLSTATLGFVTWENYRKDGLKDFKTLAFGTALAVSYISNIYGSVFTVRILKTEYNENVKSSILFNLHIPLYSTFGK